MDGIQSKIEIIYWTLAMGFCFLVIAWSEGFLKPFQSNKKLVIKGRDVLTGFGLFILAELVLLPSLFSAFYSNKPDSAISLWLHPVIILGGFVFLCYACCLLDRAQRKELFGCTETAWYMHVLSGIGTWFFIFPFVLAFNTLLSIGVLYFFPESTKDQVAVKFLKETFNHPALFGITTLEIVTIVPFCEEYLFRGLLQTWLKNTLNSTAWSIVIAAFVFACFHFSPSQGVTNFELLPSLFFLGCILGVLFEKRSSLWAPIGLHGFFNLVSVLMIFNEKG